MPKSLAHIQADYGLTKHVFLVQMVAGNAQDTVTSGTGTFLRSYSDAASCACLAFVVQHLGT
jgi:hypothetical protein